jgi:site-specific DNA-cytosine methylase
MDFGVPQERVRLYILGARKSMTKGVVNPPIRMKKFGTRPRLPDGFLKKGRTRKTPVRFSKTATLNLQKAKALEQVSASSSKPIICDLAAGPKLSRVCTDYLPTLLAGRCGGQAYYWLQDLTHFDKFDQ